jgi:glycosyltransferase involved in cell wall biosynthesis
MSQTHSERLKIAYITTTDAANKHSWSGTHHYIWKTAQKNIGDITLLGPVSAPFVIFICQVIHGFSLYILKKRFNYRDSIFLAKTYGRIFSRKLKRGNYDLIIAPAGSTNIAYLNTTVPIIYIADRTIQSTLNYHQMLTNLLDFSKHQSVFVDKKAIEKSSIAIYSSEWAAQSAIVDYQIPENKIYVIPFGANLDEIPSREIALSRSRTNVCRLLFLGVSWENKGGAIALNTLINLVESGIQAELTVCGCIPPEGVHHPNMKVIPFLNKNNAAQKKELDQLFIKSNFLILPTRFDCTPIVFCEAGAYGLPCIAPVTGGIASVITEGVNGMLVPYEAKGNVYAEKIRNVFVNESTYNALVISSRHNYEERLNWDSWAKSVNVLIKTQLSLYTD